jgi:dTMP kinase
MKDPPDRMESAGTGFHAVVADGFRDLAAAEPHRWLVVDGTGDVEAVAGRVADAWERWEAGHR